MSDSTIFAELSMANIRRDVEHITKEIPSRLAGSENAAKMAEYSFAGAKASGLDSRIESVPAIVSFPGRAEVRITAPVEMVLPATTFGHSVGTGPNGLEGELVYVGNGHISDYEGLDVAGKITLSELSYSPGRHEKQRIAGMMGSTAQLMRNWGHPENASLPFGSVKPAWGNPTPDGFNTEMPTIPCIGLSRPDGAMLIDMVKKGPVRVWLRPHVENGWRDIKITVAELMAPSSDDFVVVGGHQDSWYGEAATDNAAGSAVMMELARIFGKHRDKLRRGIVFAFWSAHETGTMAGSTWFVDTYWDRVRRHAVANVMIDQLAMLGTSRWTAHSNLEMRRFHQEVEQRLLGPVPHDWALAKKAGDSSFFGVGVPTLDAQGSYTAEKLEATAMATCGWWHHSLECTFDKLDWSFLETHVRVYVGYLWRLCTEPILPYEFVSVAEQLAGRLAEIQQQSGWDELKDVGAQAAALRADAVRLDEIAKAWNARYLSGEVSEARPAELLNDCLKKLSRILVPIASTVKGAYGQDTYSYTPVSTVIPSLYDVRELARNPKQGPDRWMWETKLVRDRNRVMDALTEARDLIASTFGQLGSGGR